MIAYLGKMKLAILMFNIVWLKNGLSFPNSNNLQMIVDVVTSYEQPTSVVANVCWKTFYKAKLATMLAKERLINIRYVTKDEIMNEGILNNHLLYLIDLNCSSSIYILNQASVNKMFSKTYRWLVVGKNNDIIEELSNLNILTDSEFIVAEEQENEDFLLHAVYKTRYNWAKECFANWTVNNGLTKANDMAVSKSIRRKDLKGTPITFSLIISDNKTKTDYAELSNIFIDAPTKSAYRTLSSLYQFMNATKVIIFSDTWGYFINDSWTGMIGDIYNGRADLCGCMTFIIKGRLPILEYPMYPKTSSIPRIVFRQPPLSYQYNLFVLPFTPNVWYCLGAFFILITIILYLNTKWDIKKYENYNKRTVEQTCLEATWSDIIIFVFSAVFQQGSSYELKGTLGRLVMFLVFLAFLFFYTSYSASIVVLLQSTSDQIRTVNDLTNSKLEFGIEDAAYNKYYFSESFARDPVRKAFYEAKISPKGSKPKFMSLEEGVKKMQSKPFAFNMNIGSGYRIISQYFQEHEKCGLVEIDYIQASKPWFCHKKNSPYTEIYRVGFIRIEEHGLSDRNNRLFFAKKPVCSVTSGNFGSVDMVDFYPVLIMLLYGMLLSCVLFVLEMLVHRRQKMKEEVNIDG